MVSNEFPFVSKVINVQDEQFLFKYAILSNIKNIAGPNHVAQRKGSQLGFWLSQRNLQRNELVKR